MKNNNKKNQTARFLKGALLFVLLSAAAGCSGGGGGHSGISGNSDGNAVIPTAIQSNAKADLCTELNAWDEGCRFLGMRLLKQDPDEIAPLTEKYGRRVVEM